MRPWLAKAPTKYTEFSRAEVLVPKHEHGMLGKRALDPRKGFIVERLRKIDPEGLGTERMSKRTQFGAPGHNVSSYAAIEATLQPGARLL
jgi:hypothetical protein